MLKKGFSSNTSRLVFQVSFGSRGGQGGGSANAEDLADLFELELNKLKPAFPDAPCSQQVFESSVKDIMKFVLKQAPSDFQQDPSELERLAAPAPSASHAADDDDDEV